MRGLGPLARSAAQLERVHRLVGLDSIGKRSSDLEPQLGHAVEQLDELAAGDREDTRGVTATTVVVRGDRESNAISPT